MHEKTQAQPRTHSSYMHRYRGENNQIWKNILHTQSDKNTEKAVKNV